MILDLESIKRMKELNELLGRCGKVERLPRWVDGRYVCDLPKGHSGMCSAWSRSASGRAALREPVEPDDAEEL